MRVITVANQKGGVGKTAVAVHLAVEAERNGMKVTVLELDKQGTASEWNEKRGGQLVNRIDATALDQMLRVLQGVQVDLVIIDMPGSHSSAVNVAVKASDFVLIPARPTTVDISASAETLSVIHRLRKDYAYLLTFVEPTQVKRADEARAALEEGEHPVCRQYVFRRQTYIDALTSGKVAAELEPKGKAEGEIREVWKWLAGKLEDAGVKRELQANSEIAPETRH